MTRPRSDLFDTGGEGSTSSGAHDPVFEPLREALRPVYQLLRRLGEGGMGAVYLAREPGLKRDVAVKVMLPWLARDETARARFDREAQAVAAIAHPNVINVFGTGELADGTPYFVMQFVRGRSLEERLAAEGPLSVREARRVLAEVAAALAAAHARGIVHRDIKAANVLQDAESGRVVVTDFGIAAVREPADQPRSARLTQPDAGSPGTPAYMAPEQLLGEETTEASDVYAFGLLAYELLTGAGPFQATTPHEIAAAHLRDDPPPLSHKREDVDAELDVLVGTCLAKQPAERPTTENLVQRLPPGDALSLEWPPPGLDRLAGRLPRMTRRLGLGSTLLAAAILAMILVDPDSGRAPSLLMLEGAALAGGLVLLSGVWTTQYLLRDARKALRAGYAWLPVMEVVADRHGDTGAMISGLREYAALNRAQRSRLRAGRLIAAASAFAAALMPLLVLLVVIRMATRGLLPPWGAALAVILPSVILLEVTFGLRFVERRLVLVRRAPRARRKGPPPVARNVVQAWNESFETARTGQPLGARAPHPTLTRSVIGVLLVMVALAVIAVVPLALVPVLGYVVTSGAVPKFSGAMGRIARGEAARPWTVPRDSAISAAAAGQAFHALLTAGDRSQPFDTRAPERPLAVPLAPPYGGPFARGAGRYLDTLFTIGARRGFTPAQVHALDSVARLPGWSEFHLAARAARVDLISARYTAAALDTLNHWLFSIPRYTRLRSAADAAAAVAALRLQQGRTAEAEQMLREAMSVGLNLADHGILLIEAMVGSNIAADALGRLELLYTLTHQPDKAQRIRTVRDSVRAEADRAADESGALATRGARNAMAEWRQDVIALVTSPRAPLSFRWEYIGWLNDMSCFNAREMVFGPAPELDSAVVQFERQALRTPGDSLWLRAMLGENRLGSRHAWVKPVAGAFAGAIGNPRLKRCMTLIFGTI